MVWVDPEGLVADTVVDAALAVWDVGTAIKCPTWQNVGMAAVSVAALAVPFVPNAIGYARHADDVVKGAGKLRKFLRRPPGYKPNWKVRRGRYHHPNNKTTYKAHPAGPKNPHGDHWDVVNPPRCEEGQIPPVRGW